MSDSDHDEAAPGGAAAAAAAAAAPAVAEDAGARAARFNAALHTDMLLQTRGSLAVQSGADAMMTLRDAMLAAPHGRSVMRAVELEFQAMGVAYSHVVQAYLDRRALYHVCTHTHTHTHA